MITPYKDRVIDYSKPVRVYRNLHNKCYSIQQNGKVVAHAEQLELKECRFIVNQAGRRRVLSSGSKNVHAFVEGFMFESDKKGNYRDIVKYNPHKDVQFKTNDISITKAKYVSLQKSQVTSMGAE